MRHFAGVLFGIVLVPVFFGLNWLVNHADGNVGDNGGGRWLVLLLATYALVGVLVALFLASRSISPLALLLGGLIIAVAEVMLFLPRVASLKVNIPWLYDHPGITDGYLLVAVGAALLVGGFFPTRWHRPRPKNEDDDEDLPVAGGTLLPTGDEESARDSMYDASWGTGRNEYAEEPEAPYVTRSDQGPSTQTMPVTQPGEYDRPPSGYEGQAGQYDQQALGYRQENQRSRYEEREPEPDRYYEDPPTEQYEQPATIHDQSESQPSRSGYDDRQY